MQIRTLGLALVALVLGGCGSSSTSPSSVSLGGNYVGNVSDSVNGAGTALMTLEQNGASVTGTYSVQYAAGTASGSLNGTTNGASLSGTLQPSNPTLCPSNVTATIGNGGSNLSGTYAAFNCTGSESGTFNVNRQ
jgi:hypothetical protein